MTRFALLALLPSIFTLCPSCFAQSTVVPRVGWEILVAFEDAPPEITVGVNDGSGFQFATHTDDNDDGIIRLPRAPIGSQLAIVVHNSNGGEDFHLWDVLSAEIAGGPSFEIPLFTAAEAIPGSSVGVQYKPLFAFLVDDLENRVNVIDGRVDDWPNIRFVDASNAPDLASFVQLVDMLRDFNGDVVVSDVRVRFAFVPEPASWLLLFSGAMAIAGCRRMVGRW